MLDERFTLSPSLANEITRAAAEAAQKAVAALFASKREQAEKDLALQQKNKPVPLDTHGQQRTELYPIRVTHANNNGRLNTEVSMEGSPLTFLVEQSWPFPNRQTTWKVVSKREDREQQILKHDVTDHEAAVQQAVVALLGSVWYALDKETAA